MRKIYMSSRPDVYQKPNGRAKFGGFPCRIRSENTFDTFRGTKSYGHFAMLKETCRIQRPENTTVVLQHKSIAITFSASDTRAIDKFPPPPGLSPKAREGKPSKAVTCITPEGEKITRYCGEKDQYLMVFGVVYSRRTDGIFRPKNSKSKIKTPVIKKIVHEKMPGEYKKVVVNGKSYRIIKKVK